MLRPAQHRSLIGGSGLRVAQAWRVGCVLLGTGTAARSADPTTLPWALTAAGIASRIGTDSAVRTEAHPVRVGEVALAAGIALTELRPADGAGLEEMFLELTAASQREQASEGQAA